MLNIMKYKFTKGHNMKKIILIVSAFIITLLMTACGGSSFALSPAQQKIVGSDTIVYTQVGMWVEKNRVYGTNYNRGLHMPVNTEVKIVSVNAKTIVFEYLDSNINYYVYTKHTKIDAAKTLERLFSSNKVDLSKYDKKAQSQIIAGTVENGMTKDAVLLSRGYPPLSSTLSIKADYWKYYKSKFFGTMGVQFTDGKVSSIKGGGF